MSIPIDTSVRELRRRIVDVLREYLPGELAAIATRYPGYPLPVPEAYLIARADPQQTFRRLNLDEVAVWVTKEGASQVVSDYTGSGAGGTRARTQDTQIRVTLIAKARQGYTLPYDLDLDRDLVEEEWLEDRGELYKGAIMNTITKHATGGPIADITIDANHGEYAEINNFGRVATAVVIFGASQDVLIST